MTQEEKQLLWKDLCARLPYRVRCKCINGLGGGETDHGVLKYIGNCNGVISNYYEDIPIDSGCVNNVFYPIENIKPYLRPMSSMTESEMEELRELCGGIVWKKDTLRDEVLDIYYRHDALDWLLKHHFDTCGLIGMGLALEAPEGMYDEALNIQKL